MTAASTTSTSSTVRGVALSVVVATIAASVVNTVISLIAQALGADATRVMGLEPAIYIIFTLVGTIIGAIGWVIVRDRATAPAALLRWLVPTVVVVTWIPDVLLAVAGLGWGVVGLMLMHPVVAAAAVLSYRRFLPLPR